MIETTLVYLIHENTIILAKPAERKKYRYLNGYGGKVESGETNTQAAVRELYEESNVKIEEKDLELIGINTFLFSDQEVYPDTLTKVYIVRNFDPSSVKESEEMSPLEFELSNPPLNQMWPADQIFFPFVVKGEYFEIEFRYGAVDELLSWTRLK